MAVDLKEEIHLASIERELSALWNEEQGKNRTRACLFTLVVYLKKNGHDATYLTRITSVIAKFPCRLILITHDAEGKESLKTAVTAGQLPEGIYCEIIEIAVAGALQERVPYLVLPHILPDLPLYLLWTQDPLTETTILPFLEPFATRVIFDPETSPDLQKSAGNVLSLIQRSGKEVGDLHWSASRGWRNIFASLFDLPENRAHLKRLKALRILYNQKNSRKAAYFQAWLASCLKWDYKGITPSGNTLSLQYRSSGQEVTVLLTAYDDPLAPVPLPVGALLEMELESGEQQGHFSFKRHPDKQQLFFQYADQNRCDLPKCLFLGRGKEGQEIIDEIFYPSPSKHYQKMLTFLSHIPWRER